MNIEILYHLCYVYVYMHVFLVFFCAWGFVHLIEVSDILGRHYQAVIWHVIIFQETNNE